MKLKNELLKEKCLEHWNAMLNLTVDDIISLVEYPSQENCAFCNEYWEAKSGEIRCFGCPIHAKTGKHACRRTPFKKAYVAYVEINEGESKDLENFRKRVTEELRFLEKL